MTLDIIASSPAMGARISGVDLLNATESLVHDLREQLLKFHVITVSDQDLDRDQLQEFGYRWGELLTHPGSANSDRPKIQVLASNRPVRGRGLGAWHSDMSWHPTPPSITMLHARTLPARGGDTGYANQHLAYEMLERATEDRGRSFRRHLVGPLQIEQLLANHSGKRFGKTVPDSVHPMVRTHDETGEKALYVNPEFTTHVIDVDESESERILYPLWMHCVSEEFVYRHRWRRGDLNIWDNRSVMHTSILDYTEPRALTRVVVKGGRPQ